MKKMLIILGLLLTASFLAEVILLAKEVHGHGHAPWWHTIKAAQGLIGLASGVALMFFAKTIGKLFLYRNKDYYETSSTMSFPRRRESNALPTGRQGSPTKPFGDDNASEDKS